MLSPTELMERSLSVELHLSSMEGSKESALGDGVTSGSLALGEEVTWRARHFGIWWTMTAKVTELQPGRRFVDEQVRGPFRRFRHEHVFDATDNGTVMTDRIDFDAPLGPIGDLTERLLLRRHMHDLIVTRNAHLAAPAEPG
ncbi:SRPBCC family protein [Aeromicrobium sp. CF4.19]|uniref:SRPBCC family protein n=1 Tax=Aeromicrobium sp. CF4.19 TaxID=3373082 RepID=UPI003EE4B8F3